MPRPDVLCFDLIVVAIYQVRAHISIARAEAARLSGKKSEDEEEDDDFGEGVKAVELGNLLWLAANTKRCPRCQTPTEKNEGCNHMTCKR